MLALLSILFALALLGLTVYALHKYQTMEVEFNVDRNVPLPPLDSDPDTDSSPVSTEPKTTATNTNTAAPSPAVTPRPRPAKTKTAAPNTGSWQDRVSQLKNAGDFSQAASVCEQQLPLWGAYNQLCMLIRSEMKTAALDARARESRMARLYKTAAMAELLHDKSGASTRLTNNQLREIDLATVAALEFPYSEIGYAHLRLIRKSDIKHMVDFWGRPDAHTTPREHHANWWEKQLKS